MNMRPQERYDKANMAMVGAKYKKEFIKEFKEACKSLGITQSEVIRKAMQETIDKAKESRWGFFFYKKFQISIDIYVRI